MKYSVDYIPDKNIVMLKMEGRLNFQIAEQFSKEALKLARQNQCNKFLFDHTDTQVKNESINLHLAGDELQQFGFTESDLIAVLLSNHILKNVSDSFISINSRWSVVKYFNKDNSEKAYNWLLEQQ